MDYVIGVDVGTGSVRAGLFTSQGQMLTSFTQNLKLFTNKAESAETNDIQVHMEQSSNDIWTNCCSVIKSCVLSLPEQERDRIVSIAFDATCSLVVVRKKGTANVSISMSGDPERDVILWACHRASQQVQRINKTNHSALNSVGKIISPEMQIPKLLWIKEKLPNVWNNLEDLLFFDLADFLVYKCTGADQIRSENTVICKWLYNNEWQSDFLEMIGLGELVKYGFAQIGSEIKHVGEPVSNGITELTSKQTLLKKGTTVSTSMIDAYAGSVGILSTNLHSIDDICSRLALISGTSSCHMTLSKKPVLINGVWGPYYNAMIPGYWVNEGGQSAVGLLIDHIVSSHAHYSTAMKQCSSHMELHELLHKKLESMSSNYSTLTHYIHILPYFHGNRSPYADPSATGTIAGLTISNTLENLALVYLAAIQSIAYSSRHIIECINKQRILCGECEIQSVYICGGLAKNRLFVEQHAQICDCSVIVTENMEAMLLGCAILAYKAFTNIQDENLINIMIRMNNERKCTIYPKLTNEQQDLKEFHNKKYKIFHLMYTHSNLYKNIMNNNHEDS